MDINIFANMLTRIQSVLRDLCLEDDVVLQDDIIARIAVEPPRNDASGLHGEIASNAAMVCGKSFACKPIDLANRIALKLRVWQDIQDVTVAGPGFINITLTPLSWHKFLNTMMGNSEAFQPNDIGRSQSINVEYVSANPTGPIHLGHIRGAVFGDVLANILGECGYDVTREYYVNDGGNQIDTLARSAMIRYRAVLGYKTAPMVEGMYPGDYLIDLANDIAAKYKDQFIQDSLDGYSSEFKDIVVNAMLDLIRSDLKELGVVQKVFVSEKELVKNGAVEAAFQQLQDNGLIYEGVLEAPKGKVVDEWEPKEQSLFKATQFGDDVDRPMKKSNKEWTYFASDVANHFNKYQRGFLTQINVFGADHGGYIKRIQAATQAVSKGKASLEVLVCQTVRLVEEKKLVKMSKRQGNFVTLRELLDNVGKDCIRFFMLMRRNDAPLDFDLSLARASTRENPIFYIQYAHARTVSLEQKLAKELGDEAVLRARAASVEDMSVLTRKGEMAIIQKIAEWPRMLESAAKTREPHKVAYYLIDLASLFHQLWTGNKEDGDIRFINQDDYDKSCARIALAFAVRTVLAKGLRIIAIQPAEILR